MKPVDLITIGTSAGGVTALQKLFSYLPPSFSTPIVIVQHLPASATVDPSLIFHTPFNSQIVEAEDKTLIEAGGVYFAPPGYHLLIERDRSLSLSQDDLVHFARPSIDVLFESAVPLGDSICAVLLTGANADGASGLKAIKEAGGFTIVQDPGEAEATAMPRAAISLFNPDFVGKIESIALKLSWFEKRGAPA